jgi:hypothetical protein
VSNVIPLNQSNFIHLFLHNPIVRPILAYLTINNRFRHVELTNHAKRDSSSTWFGVVKLTLKEYGVNILLLSKDFSSAGSRRPSTIVIIDTWKTLAH